LGQNLAPGLFADAQRASFVEAGHPGLDVFGDGRGSNQVTGSFTIHQIQVDYSGTDPVLVSFSASFEQHSEGGPLALTGTVNYNVPSEIVVTAIAELPGEGIDTVRSPASMALPANFENLTLTGSSSINATGNELNNVLTGNSGDNALDGGTGSDAAVFEGIYSQYLVTGQPTGSGHIDGPDGTDALTSIEQLQFVDGSLTYDPGAGIAQAARLYLATLDRLPDGLGLSFYVDLLKGGTPLDAIASNFVASPEFQSIYGSLDNTQFVNQLYLNVLNRPADPDGLAFHVGNLDAGVTRGQVVVGFSESPEFITNNASLFAAGLWDIDETAGSVARLYLGILDRVPDVGGLKFHTEAIKSGQLTLGQDANNFAASPEFQNVYGSLSNSDFVNLLYQNVLDRPADADGLAFHLNNLANGFSRGDVAVGFTESPEYQIKTIGQIDHGIVTTDGAYVP
jgi:hypothetical protein